MTISDLIEQMLHQMLSTSDGSVEIRRNILANQLNCVPSQINYVIKTRFTPERGYYIESRRGGGGSVTIRRVETSFGDVVSYLINSVGTSLDYPTSAAYLTRLFEENLITKREAAIMSAALSDKSILSGQKNEARAVLFKNMLITLLNN